MMSDNKNNKNKNNKLSFELIDPATTYIPLLIVIALCITFILWPEASSKVLNTIRSFLGNELGSFYLVIGLSVFIISLYFAFSPIGNITIGEKGEKPQYPFLVWGGMVFTCGLAADIIFYSLCEWILYANEQRIQELGSIQDWASTYPLFHWGPIPWSFYATLSVCFGYMLYVKGCKKQKYSEACRAILGKHTDGIFGKIVDILAVFALIAGTATTFSVATPLLSMALSSLFGISESKYLTILILITICVIYTAAVMRGIKGVSNLAGICMFCYFLLMLYFLLFGGRSVYIIETGLTAIGNTVQNFIGLSTWTDALRTSYFPQNWTIFYWAYWMVWCVASPFFMGSISKGRTVKQIICGTYIFGISSTWLSFIILGNYGLGLQMSGKLNVVNYYNECGSLYQTIIAVVSQLPGSKVVMALLVVVMILFYATSFDGITLVAAQYSYKEFDENTSTNPLLKLFWAIVLILLPIALIFSESSMSNLQTVSIIAAFPIAFVIIMIIASFVKDVNGN